MKPTKRQMALSAFNYQNHPRPAEYLTAKTLKNVRIVVRCDAKPSHPAGSSPVIAPKDHAADAKTARLVGRRIEARSQ